MSIIEDEDSTVTNYPSSRPSHRQVNALVVFMQKNPVLVQSKREGNQEKVRKLWVELAKKLNSIRGVKKSTRTWMRYWLDKRRYVVLKDRRLQTGKSDVRLSILEEKILNICMEGAKKKNGKMKCEVTNYNKVSGDEENKHDEKNYKNKCNGPDKSYESSESEEKYTKMIENMADVMERQAASISQMALTWVNHCSAMDRLADASYQQADAVGRIANSFETIASSLSGVKSAVLSIDDVLKRSLAATIPDQQNTHLFS